MKILTAPRALRAPLGVIGVVIGLAVGALLAVGCERAPGAPPRAAPAPREPSCETCQQLDTGSYVISQLGYLTKRAWVWSFGPAGGAAIGGEQAWREIWVMSDPDGGTPTLGGRFAIEGVPNASSCDAWSSTLPDAGVSLLDGLSTTWSCDGGAADAGRSATVLAPGSYTVSAPNGQIYVDETGEYWALSRIITTSDTAMVSEMDAGYRSLQDFMVEVCGADAGLDAKYRLSFQAAGSVDCQ